MNREAVLGAGAAAVVVAAAVLALAVPGVFAEPEPERVRPAHVGVREVTIAPGAVSGSTATLSVTAFLVHRGGVSENVTLVVRAIDLESGMLATSRERAVERIEGDREVAVPLDLTVEREGGYRVEAIVYRDDRRVARAAREVRGVGTLTPAYARTDVTFHRFGDRGGADLPAIQYSIANAEANRTTLDLSAYLTNRGDDPAGDLRVEFIVRQAESNIVAARTSVAVGGVPPGRTVTPGAEVAVPAGYNYYLDAILWKRGVIVATARSVANLDPTERIDRNATVREVGLEVSDFEGDDGGERTPAPAPTRTATAGQPGFGVPATLLALAALVAFARRYRS